MGVGTTTELEQVIQSEIERLVAELLAADAQVPDLFRRLCRLAQERTVAPEDFRCRLVRAGLPYPRASEFKSILWSANACAKFLHADPAQRLSWLKSLKLARDEFRLTKWGLTDEPRRAAMVAGWMHRLGLTELELPGGRLVLTPTQQQTRKQEQELATSTATHAATDGSPTDANCPNLRTVTASPSGFFQLTDPGSSTQKF